MKISKLSIFLMIALVVVICLLFKSCGDAAQYERVSISNKDTLKITRNFYNQQKAVIGILQGSVSDLQKLNSDKDAVLKRLQKITDKYSISSNILENSTSNAIVSNTIEIIYYDTIRKDSLIYIYPEYSTNYLNKWERINVKASREKIKIEYTVFNDFEITTRYNKPVWYKMRTPEITVINANPNTETLGLKNFTVSPPKNQKLFIFLAGIGSGLITAAYVGTKLK